VARRRRGGRGATKRAEARGRVSALRGLRAARWLSPAALVAFLLAAAILAGSAWSRALGPQSVLLPATETTKAPKITRQPVNVTVEAGHSATFTSTASGTPTPSVQWELSSDGGVSWARVEGATATSLTIASASPPESGDEYRAVFRNVAGEVTSKAATLTVQYAPAVTQQPVSTTVEAGQEAVFEASASGSPTPSVKWETSANGTTWSAISGATSNKLTIPATTTSMSGREYRATFKNTVGAATSETVTLTVQKAPTVTKQPASITVNEGQRALFEAAASGFPAPTVHWEVSTDGGGTWSPIEGATSNQLAIASAQLSEDGYQYRAVFHNAAGTATSQAATLTVHAPPVITQQPAGTIVEVGESATFTATASGYPAPTVQWELSSDGGKTWSAISGATTDQLTIEGAQVSENGQRYRAVFTNISGTATSNAATLTVATNRYSAVAWGENAFRQLGDGSTSLFSDVPVPVSGLKFVTAVAAGGRHSLALRADGTVVAWGANGLGQLGDGSTSESSNVPVAVLGLSGVKALAAGGYHSLALLSNGTVMAWGDNESGQLGIGSSVESVDTPVAVKGLTGVKAISAGANFSLALLSNGTVMAWGENESGQLGNGGTTPSQVPVAVKHLTGATAISAGGEFSLALLTNETLEAWGNDEHGQLANGTVEEGANSLPLAVKSPTGVAAVAAGTDHALALLGNGTVMAWGANSAGELGNGTTQSSEGAPVPVNGLSGVTAVSASDEDSAALLTSGSVMTWGTDESGVLGDGVQRGLSDVPVGVVGLAKAASISAGRAHMLAFGEPIPTVTSVSPKIGPATGGGSVAISGTEFTGATAVRFGTAEAASFSVNSPTSITAIAPPGTGTVDITVTTPSGISPPSAADRYTFQAAPTVEKLSAKSGPAGGGTRVTITGTEFTGATAIRFGTDEAASFSVNSPTSITAVAPAHTGGLVDVTVTNTIATSAASLADRFKYIPAVLGLAPNTGSTLGGTSVTVTGEGFAEGGTATTFKFGNVKATVVNCTSGTSCTVTAPAHEAATVDVVATVNKAKSALNAPADQFTYG
jgi:alpha-tubulin suppressor-like RCC1 family protein